MLPNGYRLQNKVIDLEVAASTPSPTIDPSVHTILIGHSMGGIVAAETLLAIASEPPIPSSSPADFSTLDSSTDPLPSTAAHSDPATSPDNSNHSSFMFPYISGILAFDTPYLGICPGVIAHGAETHYKTASTYYNTLSDVAGVFGWGAGGSTSSSKSAPSTPNLAKSNDKLASQQQGTEAMTASMTASSQDAAATPTWQRWGKYAMFAGAAGAVAAGGAAAYLKRDRISEGWTWMGSHLEFVGCLAKAEELKSRLDRIVALNRERGIGFADLVTVLGKSATSAATAGKPPTRLAGGFVEIGGASSGERTVAASQRTFCTIPRSERNRRYFEPSRNDVAKDETEAHMTMFERKANSGYFVLADRAKILISEWVEPSEWYQSSEPLPREDEETFEEGLMMDVDLGEGDADDKKAWAGEEPVLVDRAP